MIAFKCKICGGKLEIEQEARLSTCESCGTTHSLPSNVNDERIRNLYERANQLRRDHSFDKAMGMYETILTEQPNDPEVYWSLILCKYGVEYVEDPKTKQRVITTHRTLPQSVKVDPDYKKAVQLASRETKNLYEKEAESIDAIQKGILTISNQEDPYDIFICYKETDEQGRRTIDSKLAQDLYEELEGVGYKVFFARLTLEDKLGQEYEPYIYSALKTSKVMLVLGTKKDYFESPWVRNEWSRYLTMMKGDKNKKIIPLYRDIDAYDLPEEFRILQSQDLNKIGASQDLVRGIKKLIPIEETAQASIKVAPNQSLRVDSNNLLKRAKIALEDKDFEAAIGFAEKMLDVDPENAHAYYIRYLAKNNRTSIENCFHVDDYMIEEYGDNIENLDNYYSESVDENDADFKRIVRFGKEKVYEEIQKAFDTYRQSTLTSVIKFLSIKVDILSTTSLQKRSLLEETLVKFNKITKLSIFRTTDKHVVSFLERKTIEFVIQRADIMQVNLLIGDPLVNSKSILNFLKPYMHFEPIQHYTKKLQEKISEYQLQKEETEVTKRVSHYEKVVQLIKLNTIKAFKEAIKTSILIAGFRDVDSLKEFALKKLSELEKIRRKRMTMISIVSTFIVSILTATGYILFITLPLAEISLDGATYKKDGNSYTLSHFDGNNTFNWKMPNGIRGLPVTKIGTRAFFQQSIRTIELGYFVERIEEEAFYESEIISITFSPRLKFVGNNAFSQSKLTALNLPNSVEEIGDTILKGINSLLTFTTPFMGFNDQANGSLHYFFGDVLPNNLRLDYINIYKQRVIPSTAFAQFMIHELYLGKSVNQIMLNAFDGINNLQKIHLPFLGENRESAIHYHIGYGFGAEILADQATAIPETLKEVIIHDDYQIEPFALSQLQNIESFTFIEGTSRLSSYAISQNEGLTEIFLGKSIVYVGPLAIYQVGNPTIYVEHDSIPSEWSDRWNESALETVLGATLNE